MAKKLWGGRFSKATDPKVEVFTRSVHFDQKLAAYDVIGSLVHVAVLKKARFLTPTESGRISQALVGMLKSIEKRTFRVNPDSEDIHSVIQNALEQKIGDVARKLHTGRSRNDQVAFATRLYSKVFLRRIDLALEEMIAAIHDKSREYQKIILPGMTHLQHAQPVYLSDYWKAYVLMLERDQKRLRRISDGILLTQGAGALAGTPIPAACYAGTIRSLTGFDPLGCGGYHVSAARNAMDSVSDRDFVIETIGALSLAATHLSRLAEDLIIWCSKEFDFIWLDDAYCTGSSLMPQKKNPDVLELVRGYSGRLYGNLVSVLTMMKGLPLTYNRDMQLDKEPLFHSFEILTGEIEVMSGLVRTMKFNRDRIEQHLKDEALYATDLVYYLIKKGIPFKTAHTIVGELVKYSLGSGEPIQQMPESELKRFSPVFVKADILELFDPRVSVLAKKSIKRH